MAFYEYSKLKRNAFLLLSILVKWKNNSLSMFLYMNSYKGIKNSNAIGRIYNSTVKSKTPLEDVLLFAGIRHASGTICLKLNVSLCVD